MFKRISWGVVAVIALWGACFWYVLELQHVFYTNTGPYFDSVSYYMQLAWAIARVHSSGFWSALNSAFVGSNVAIVGVAGSLLGLFTDKPELWMGPAIQSPWILFFWLTLYGYLRHILKQARLISLLASSLFIINPGVFYFDRGWSDFAMDLMGYVVLGNALIFYLWSFRSERRWPLVAAGVLFGFSTWWRVPDAVHIVLILLPLEIWRLWNAPRKLAYLQHFLWLAIPAAVVAGVFLLKNFTFLHWYYVVMNVDVHAHLPIQRALCHWKFLWHGCIGTMVAITLLAWFSVSCIETLRTCRHDRVRPQFNWVFLWCGFVPVGYLILSGSGPDAYVCFPSMFGMLLFLLFPWKNPGKLSPISVGFLTIVTVWCWGQTFLQSYARHTAGQIERPRMVMEAALTSLTRDAEARKLSNATVAIGYVGFWNAYAWQYMLVYFHNARTAGDSSVTYKNIRFTARPHYDWMDAVESGNAVALNRAFGGIDYMYLLEPSALPKFEKVRWSDASTTFISRFEAAIRERYSLLAVSPPITLSSFEQFRLYHLTPR